MSIFFSYIKIVTGTLFLICCLLLPFLLISLGLSKKKLKLYIQQLESTGEITKKLNNIKVAFDPLLALYLFDPIPKQENYPDFFKEKEIKDLIQKIMILTTITKPIVIAISLLTIFLIVFLNIYEN